MPAANYSGGRGSPGRRGFRYRSLPLWLQWVLPFSVATALVLAVVLYVNYETNDVPAVAGYNSPAAVAEQYREDNILVRQQQAPHHAKLPTGRSPAVALRGAIVSWMTGQINSGAIDGPIRHADCRAAAGGTSGRLVFRCDVTASAQMITYPFDGVVEPSAHVAIYCQRIAPPIPSMNVPVSKRCT